MARRRHLSRIAVMQVLFERERRGEQVSADALDRNIAELGEVDSDFAHALLKGVLQHEQGIQQMIQEHSPGWTMDRMDPISRCILFVGAYELVHGNDAPPAVVMNEAIDIAKEYGSEEGGKFVNGVLNAIAKEK